MLQNIIAIDPGTKESAYVLWTGRHIVEAATVDNETLRYKTLPHFAAQFGSTPPMVIEWVESYGMAVGKETFETVYWTGRFAQTWMDCGGEVIRIGRKAIKLHHCQSARAKDSNIRAALLDKYPAGNKANPGVMYGITGHKIAAFALATAWTESGGTLQQFALETPVKP